MTTPQAIAKARHAQAAADLEAAEAELLTAMRTVEPTFTGTVEAMWDRRWERLLEGVRPMWELSQAYSAWRRAWRQETKARSAAYRAALAPAQPLPQVIKPKRKPKARKKLPAKLTVAQYLEEMAA
jgi:hypothetical protein